MLIQSAARRLKGYERRAFLAEVTEKAKAKPQLRYMWMRNMLYDHSDTEVSGMPEIKFGRFMSSELDHYLQSEAVRTIIAEQNVGLPLETIT